ncbi:unnamed protein product [Sphagnum jensenii]|uniref:Uncharacterized protein n=1 Tax=Sphagnum jensenii TaxID=128206 RepID=A0ABP0XAU8_9BRYO
MSYKHHCLLFYVVLLHFMSSNRAFEYVKDNDVPLGLRVSIRAANGGPQVTGLQCRFCIAFGHEEKVGAKCQASTAVQGWMRPFHYDNIENHDSVDVIVRNMMFDPADIVDNDADNDAEGNDPAFGSDAERDVVLRQRIQKAALAKERALSLFQRVDQEEEEGNANYSYSITIPKSKTTVF